jgi:hypothetical protein
MPLPLTPGSAPNDAIESAVSFLHLPIWSNGYINCTSNNSEVSCHEIVKAAATLRSWETSKTIGYVWVNVNSKSLPDRMSMLYHGLQIAVSTNRKLYVDRTKFDPIDLPASIENTKNSMPGEELRTDHMFVCIDISSRHPKLFFQDASWPQALYIHPTIAPWLRENFGYHAAYFMGNYLFGMDHSDKKCRIKDSVNAVEGFQYDDDQDMLMLSQFENVLGRCGVSLQDSVFVVNTNEKIPGLVKKVIPVEITSSVSLVCGLRKLMSANRIIHTFGSRLGFWATALQGRAGGFVNPLDNICVNMSNSQQGSLWHTFCPKEKPICIYRTNARLLVCGSDVRNIKAYLEYLLW